MKPANRVLVTKEWPMMGVMKAISESSFKPVVNLGPGAFGYNPPDIVLNALKDAIENVDCNQYSPSKGVPRLKNALAKSYSRSFGRELNPETEILVTTGANEGSISTVLSYIEPGDEVVVMEPHFHPFLEKTDMAGGVVKFISLKPPQNAGMENISSADWSLDMEELETIVTDRTRMLILNTPHNPTGKVFTRTEIIEIGNFCKAHSLILLSDEVYFRLDHQEENDFCHPGALFPELAITVGSAGKDFAATGWRVGFLIGSPELLAPVAKAHSYICYSAPCPPQEAMAVGYEMADKNGYWEENRLNIKRKLDSFNKTWQELGLPYVEPQGGYMVLVSFSKVRIPENISLPPEVKGADFNAKICWFLINEIGVAGLPPSCFYTPEHLDLDRNWFRFAVNRDDETMELAKERLLKLKNHVAG